MDNLIKSHKHIYLHSFIYFKNLSIVNFFNTHIINKNSMIFIDQLGRGEFKS